MLVKADQIQFGKGGIIKATRVPWAVMPELIKTRQIRRDKCSEKEVVCVMHLLKDLKARNG